MKSYFVLKLTDKSQLTKIQNEPWFLRCYLVDSELFHLAYVIRFCQNVVLELDVKRALRLTIRHEKSEIQILFRPPPNPFHRIPER